MSVALSFVSPPPGLAPLTEFVLTEIPGADGLFTLESADNQRTRLFVLDASVYLPDYSPVISDDHAASASSGVAHSTSTIQPSPYGSALTISGESSRALLTSATVPSSGA